MKWENLVDVGKDKFCQSCNHIVVDFTKLSQDEFNEAQRNSPGRLCGKFKSSQLSPRFLKYAFVTSLAVSVLAPTSCATDDVPPAEVQTPPSIDLGTEDVFFETVGIVFTIDSAAQESDSTFIEEP
jgi:hypothetical protein